MTPEHRQLISQLFHDALARQADARPAFLREACAGDEALRRDVESLLAQPSSAARASLPRQPSPCRLIW